MSVSEEADGMSCKKYEECTFWGKLQRNLNTINPTVSFAVRKGGKVQYGLPESVSFSLY